MGALIQTLVEMSRHSPELVLGKVSDGLDLLREKSLLREGGVFLDTPSVPPRNLCSNVCFAVGDPV